jgi:hypothetical protein
LGRLKIVGIYQSSGKIMGCQELLFQPNSR